MSMDVRKVKLDFNQTYQSDIPSVQGDTGRAIEFKIMDGSLPKDITGETIKIFGLKPDGFRVFNNATITDAPNGKCIVELTQQMLCVAGTVQCTLVRYKNNQRLSSKKFKIKVSESVADDIEIESTSEYLALTDALNANKNIGPEVIASRGDFPTLLDRLNAIDDRIEKVYVNSYKKLNIETDDTGRIQRAIDYAKTLMKGENTAGGSGYYCNKIEVVFDSEPIYKISSPLTLYKGVAIRSTGHTRLENVSLDKSFNCFSASGSGWRMDIKGVTFVGFDTAIEISTGDIDISMINIDECVFHYCNTGIDTVSFSASRSTIFNIDKCIFYKTDVAVTNYCDKMNISRSWIYHSGYAGYSILNDGNMNIDNCLFVPVSNIGAYWIKNVHENIGQTALNIRGSRIGGEGGGIPVVYNYVSYEKTETNRQNKIISIENCQLSCAKGNIGVIKLFAIPNQISIKNCFGMYNNTNGLITIDDSFDVTAISKLDEANVNIDIDNMFYQDAYNTMPSSLYRFLSQNKVNKYPLGGGSLIPKQNLSNKIGGLDTNASITVYKIGLPSASTNGILTLECTFNIQGTNFTTQKLFKLYCRNETVENQVKAIGDLSETLVYKNSDNDISSVSASIVDNKLIITISNTSASSKLRYNVSGYFEYGYLTVNNNTLYENDI